MKNEISIRQTARNNDYLRAARATWNNPIYRTVLAIYNEQGEEAAEIYLQGFQKPPYEPCNLDTVEEVEIAAAKWTRDIQMFGVTTHVLEADVASAVEGELTPGTGISRLVISLLSDAQELVAMAANDGRPEYGVDAEQMINRVKYIVGEYLQDA